MLKKITLKILEDNMIIFSFQRKYYEMQLVNLENDDNLVANEIKFQQDGAPPHFVARMTQFLSERFPMRTEGVQ